MFDIYNLRYNQAIIVIVYFDIVINPPKMGYISMFYVVKIIYNIQSQFF